MKKKLQIHQAVLVGAFFLLLLTPLATKLTGLEYKTTLYNVGIASKPSFSLKNYWQGNYQDAFDSYYSTNFGNYPAAAKLYTQLRYDLFSLHTGYKLTGYNVVLNNNAFLEEAYIHNFLQTEDATALTPAQLHELYEKLARAKTLLDEQGKELILLVNPSKVEYFSEMIPLRYLWRATYSAKETVNLGDTLLTWSNENGVSSVDGTAIASRLSTEGIPVFYRGGHHASKPAMFWITQGVCDAIQALGYQTKQIQFDGYTTSTEPHFSMDDGRVGCENVIANPDWDYQRNSNLYRYSAADQIFYYPQYSIVSNEYHDLPDIFLMGKSFQLDVQFYLSRAGIGNRIYNWQDRSVYVDANHNIVARENWDMATVCQDFAASEIVVLEYNEYNPPSSSFCASLDALLELLESSSSEMKGTASFDRSYPSINYTSIVRGFYQVNQPSPSGDFYWMTKSGTINLSTNGEFTCQSVILDCSIPAEYFQQYWQKNVEDYEYDVYINGQKIASFPVGAERRSTFYFDVSEIDAPDGKYCVEIVAPLYFQGKDTVEKYNDDRELSLRVYSCSLSPCSVEELEGRGS